MFGNKGSCRIRARCSGHQAGGSEIGVARKRWAGARWKNNGVHQECEPFLAQKAMCSLAARQEMVD